MLSRDPLVCWTVCPNGNLTLGMKVILSNFVATAVNQPHHTFAASVVQGIVLFNTWACMRMVETKMLLLSCINPTYPKLTVTRSAWRPRNSLFACLSFTCFGLQNTKTFNAFRDCESCHAESTK